MRPGTLRHPTRNSTSSYSELCGASEATARWGPPRVLPIGPLLRRTEPKAHTLRRVSYRYRPRRYPHGGDGASHGTISSAPPRPQLVEHRLQFLQREAGAAIRGDV